MQPEEGGHVIYFIFCWMQLEHSEPRPTVCRLASHSKSEFELVLVPMHIFPNICKEGKTEGWTKKIHCHLYPHIKPCCKSRSLPCRMQWYYSVPSEHVSWQGDRMAMNKLVFQPCGPDEASNQVRLASPGTLDVFLWPSLQDRQCLETGELPSLPCF